MRKHLLVVAGSALLAAGLTARAVSAVELPENDYPTSARADYVFACMQTNGQNRIVLEKCSCSIDTIATLLPYAEYEAAETIMSVRQKGGESVAMFNSFAPYLEKVKNLKRAQVEAELRCF
ncbi:MAG: hypothetical protein WC829_14205 [Hyphomicrobium sp.]|jgi:hypothetical protein